MQHLVDVGCITNVSVAHETQALARNGLEYGEKRVALLSLGNLLSLCLGSTGLALELEPTSLTLIRKYQPFSITWAKLLNDS